MNLPDDVVKQELFHYLSVYDIMRLDSACMNHEYRPKLLEKINGVILSGDLDISIDASLFKWLGLKIIYLINMYFHFDRCQYILSPPYSINMFFHFDSPSSIENDYVDQFRYSQFVVMTGCVIDHLAVFIISLCPCLQSIGIYNKEKNTFFYYR